MNTNAYYLRTPMNYDTQLDKNPVNIAAFDIDHTIIKPRHNKTFPKDKDDWELCYKNIKIIFHQLSNYQLVFITNQLRFTQDIIYKIDRLIEYLSIDPVVLISIKKDFYRKPMTGLWDILNQTISNIDLSQSIYCGDAAGRSSDFAATDYKFAYNIGVKFIIPEELFCSTLDIALDKTTQYIPASKIYPDYTTDISAVQDIPIPHKTDKPIILLLMGYPGSGKSHISKKTGYNIVNQDTLKTRANCLKAVRNFMKKNNNIVIDSLNYTHKMRKDYIDLAKMNNYYIHLIHITNDIDLCMHMNNYRYQLSQGVKKLVPKVVFFKMRKHFEMPSTLDGIDQIDRYFNYLDNSILSKEFYYYY